MMQVHNCKDMKKILETKACHLDLKSPSADFGCPTITLQAKEAKDLEIKLREEGEAPPPEAPAIFQPRSPPT